METAKIELWSQAKSSGFKGPVEIDIALCSPHNRRYDPDNRIKAILDLLVKNGIIEDDNDLILRKLVVSPGGDIKGAKVRIKGL